MTRSCLTVRNLCLLLLLQFVGGPLIIMGVAVLGKITVKHSIEHGFKAGIARAIQCEEWQATCEKLAEAATENSHSTKSGTMPKTKDLKSKFTPIAWTEPAALRQTEMKKEPPWRELRSLVSSWPQAPPNPPPRLA